MKKICSLDFIKIEQIPTDVLDTAGNVILQANTKPDEQWILKYYFKDIYTEEVKVIVQEPETVEVAELETEISEDNQIDMEIEGDESPDSTEDSELAEEETVEEENLDDKLEPYSEEQVNKISDIALKLSSMFGYSEPEKEKLKKIAKYCNISLDQFTKRDLKDKKFSLNKAKKSHEMLMTQPGVSDEVKNAIGGIVDVYDTVNFSLDPKIPLTHIMFIIYIYEDLMLKFDNNKERVLEKMLQYGGNRFNVFVLHKFLKIVREMND